jgi:hypothetical protein
LIPVVCGGFPLELTFIKTQPTVQEILMAHAPDNTQPHAEQDVVESIVHHMPVVLPVAGAVLIFLLAFIAVFMA